MRSEYAANEALAHTVRQCPSMRPSMRPSVPTTLWARLAHYLWAR